MITPEQISNMLQDGEITPQEIAENGWLCSVTQRISKIKQPRGGYLPPKLFDAIELEGGGISDLNPTENVNAGLVGMTIDYMTRVMSGSDTRRAFKVAHAGAEKIGELDLYDSLLSKVHGMDDESIRSAIRLSGFDVCYRAGVEFYRPVMDIDPDAETIENVRSMVTRSLAFFDVYGPIVLDGPTFVGGYTGYVSSGDADFTTSDTIWDFKVSKQKINNKQTLQVLMYWRLGLHSIHAPEFEEIKNLGLYNPRTNIVYLLPTNKIPEEVITTVDREVIGYSEYDVVD